MAGSSRRSTGSTTSTRCLPSRLAVGLVPLLLAVVIAAAPASAAPPPIGIVTGQDAGWPDVRGWSRVGDPALQIAPWGFDSIRVLAVRDLPGRRSGGRR